MDAITHDLEIWLSCSTSWPSFCSNAWHNIYSQSKFSLYISYGETKKVQCWLSKMTDSILLDMLMFVTFILCNKLGKIFCMHCNCGFEFQVMWVEKFLAYVAWRVNLGLSRLYQLMKFSSWILCYMVLWHSVALWSELASSSLLPSNGNVWHCGIGLNVTYRGKYLFNWTFIVCSLPLQRN